MTSLPADVPSPALGLPPTTKSFADNCVLDHVPLTIAAGEVRGLVGLNGSGKSTLVKLLAGYHQPDTPVDAVAAGTPFSVGDHVGAHHAGIRFVHQDLALVDLLTTVDNVAIGSGYVRRSSGLIDWAATRQHTSDILEDLGYSFDIDAPVEELTPSQRTGVAVARALGDWAEGGRLIVLDEPTASMPISEVQNLFRAIELMRAQGVAVVLVSHRLDEILAIVDSVSVLRNGVLVGTEAVDGLTHTRLVNLMLGKDLRRGAAPTKAEGEGPVLLSARDLGTNLIRTIDLGLRAGEIVGIAGLAGSGREELLPAIFGTVPRTGEVQVRSKALKSGSPPKAVAAGLGYVPAHRLRDALFPDFDMTANLTISNLGTVSRHHLVKKSAERAQMRGWIEELAVVPPDPSASVLTMSGGNQQKVVVGRWARRFGDVSVLLLDEPTQGVDVSARESIYDALRAFVRRGAVLVSSSDSEELCRICDRTVVFYQGDVVAELDGEAMTVNAIDGYSLGIREEAASGTVGDR